MCLFSCTGWVPNRERLHSWTGPSCPTHRTCVPARDTNVVSHASSDPVADLCFLNLGWLPLPVCVYSVREAVCVFGERGVLRPGQTLVERDNSGLCHSRQCSRSLDPASGFYLLRTSSINCSAHCQPVRPPNIPVQEVKDPRIFCFYPSTLDILLFRIRSTRLQKISQHAAVFARTFPASMNTRTGPLFSIRYSRLTFSRNSTASSLCASRWCVSSREGLGCQTA